MQQILCRPLHQPESQAIAHERSSSTSSKQRSRLSDSDEHLKDYVREQSHNVSPEVILDRVCMSFEDERSYLLREPITRDELGYELNNILASTTMILMMIGIEIAIAIVMVIKAVMLRQITMDH